MSRKIEIVMVRMYRVIDNETGVTVFETLDFEEAEAKAGFSEPADEPTNYSLSDCINWETNTHGDCAGRVEPVTAPEGWHGTKTVIMCETCRNRP